MKSDSAISLHELNFNRQIRKLEDLLKGIEMFIEKLYTFMIGSSEDTSNVKFLLDWLVCNVGSGDWMRESFFPFQIGHTSAFLTMINESIQS